MDIQKHIEHAREDIRAALSIWFAYLRAPNEAVLSLRGGIDEIDSGLSVLIERLANGNDESRLAAILAAAIRHKSDPVFRKVCEDRSLHDLSSVLRGITFILLCDELHRISDPIVRQIVNSIFDDVCKHLAEEAQSRMQSIRKSTRPRLSKFLSNAVGNLTSDDPSIRVTTILALLDQHKLGIGISDDLVAKLERLAQDESAPMVQDAAILFLGNYYQGSGREHILQTLSKIANRERLPDSTRRRAGIAVGLVERVRMPAPD